MALLSSLANGGYGARSGWGSPTPDARTAGDWFQQQGAPQTGPAPGQSQESWEQGEAYLNSISPGRQTAGQTASGDASWWNPQDPKGSLDRLFQGQPPSSQTILAHAPQLRAAGIEISPPNAEGVTSKINIPGVGWTRILEGGVAGGAGTGWNYVPQGTTGPGGSIPMGGGAPGDPLAELQKAPGYQFRLQQGAQALERSAAARGTLLTGGTLKGLTRYAQDYASGEYNNRYNQLFGVAGLGANATAAQAGANSQYATNAGDLLTQQGNAQAAGTIGQSNAWQNTINNATNQAQMYYLTRLYGQQPPAGGGGPLPPHLGGQ